jgi:AcrR family transcriptional regulator
MSKTPPKKAAKQKRKPHRRREFVVQNVLRAALAELELHGFGAFRVERVAKVADVNKTTIYRRWPRKELLIKAALAGGAPEGEPKPAMRASQGSPRDRFSALSEEYLGWMGSEVGRGFARLAREPAKDAALARIMREWHAERKKPLARFAREQGAAPGLATEVFVNAWTGALTAAGPQGKPPARTVIPLAARLLLRD